MNSPLTDGPQKIPSLKNQTDHSSDRECHAKKKKKRKEKTRRGETPSCQRKEGTTHGPIAPSRFRPNRTIHGDVPRLINIISHPPLGPVGSRSSKSRTPQKRPSHSKVSLIPLPKLLLVLQTKLIDLAAKTIRIKEIQKQNRSIRPLRRVKRRYEG